jgi:hypothetical protein
MQYARRVVFRLSLVASFAGLLWSCGDNIEPAPPCFGSNALTIEVRGDTPIVVLANDNETWENATVVEMGVTKSTYLGCVANTYRVAVLCQGDRELAFQRNWTYQEASKQTFSCGAVPAEAAVVRVSGSMRQPGSVSIAGTRAFGSVHDWDFAIDLAPGTYDLISASNDRVDVVRNVSVDMDMVIPAIDLDRQGFDLGALPLTLDGTDTESDVGTEFRLVTSNDTTARFTADSPTLRLPPPEVLSGNDSLSYVISIRDGGTQAVPLQTRTVTERFVPGIQTVVLPPRLSPDTIPLNGVSALILGRLPVVIGATVTLELEDLTAVGRVAASPGWLSATNASELRFEQASLPLTAEIHGRIRRAVSLSLAVGASGFSTSVQFGPL